MFELLFDFRNYYYNLHAIPVMIVSILIFSIGLLILFKTKRTVKSISFFGFCLSSTLWLFTMGFVYCSNNPYTALLWYKHFTFLGVANLMPTLYLFSVASSGVLKTQRKYVIGAFAVSSTIYWIALKTDIFISMPRLYYWGYYPQYKPSIFLFLLFFLVMFIASQVNLRTAYKRESDSVKKTQIVIISVSLFFGFTAFIDFAAKIWVVKVYPVGFISMFILTCLLAYSIIKYRAFDIDTVIHKTILWVLSFSLITMPICLFYRWVFSIIKEHPILQFAFGIMSFFIFTLYLRLIQPRIDHFFQRREVNLGDISSQFIEDMVHLKGLELLIAHIEDVIRGTLYSQKIEIFIYDDAQEYKVRNAKNISTKSEKLKNDESFLKWLTQNDKVVRYREFFNSNAKHISIQKVATDYFERRQVAVVIPLVLNEQLLGVINLGKKSNFSRYSTAEIRFLTTLKNQSAIAISNSLIYQNIEEQVKKQTAKLVKVQKQLIQAEKLATVGILSGGVAHEINNPLTAILTNVQMMLMFSDDEDAKVDTESLKLIEEATQRCRGIVQKLMTYAKKPLESTPISQIDLASVLDKVVAFLSYQLEQEGVMLRVRKNKGRFMTLGDHNELEQVLTNIILNATDAITEKKQKGDIHISLFNDKDLVKLQIKDEGKGIEKDTQEKIFDPFFTTKDVGKGLGLGLSICQSIIEKHHGKIAVQSELNKGTTFTIQLPYHSKEIEESHSSDLCDVKR